MRTRRVPVGVVGGIVPWNFPVMMAIQKIVPAMLSGCTIVLKPAEATPLCAVEMFKVLHDADLPAGVVNLVTARDPAPVGGEFLANPAVSSDLVLSVRYQLVPGAEHGRPLDVSEFGFWVVDEAYPGTDWARPSSAGSER